MSITIPYSWDQTFDSVYSFDNMLKGSGNFSITPETVVTVFVELPEQEAYAASFTPTKPKAKLANKTGIRNINQIAVENILTICTIKCERDRLQCAAFRLAHYNPGPAVPRLPALPALSHLEFLRWPAQTKQAFGQRNTEGEQFSGGNDVIDRFTEVGGFDRFAVYVFNYLIFSLDLAMADAAPIALFAVSIQQDKLCW